MTCEPGLRSVSTFTAATLTYATSAPKSRPRPSGRRLRAKGLEPPWLAPHGPKPCACTNSATPAGQTRIYPRNIGCRECADDRAGGFGGDPGRGARRRAGVRRDHARPAEAGGDRGRPTPVGGLPERGGDAGGHPPV